MKKIALVFLSVLAVLSLFCISCSSGGDSTGDEDPDGDVEIVPGNDCTDDEDCDAGLICENGYCIQSSDGDSESEASDGDSETIPGNSTIAFDTDTIDFGAPIIFDRVERTLVISSTGEGTLEINSIDFDGSTPSDYTMNNRPTDTLLLNPGETYQLILAYTASNLDFEGGLLKIYSNDKTQPVASISLVVQYKGTPDIELDTEAIDFGLARVGGTSIQECVTVSNIPSSEDDNKVITVNNIKLSMEQNINFEISPLPRAPYRLLFLQMNQKKSALSSIPKQLKLWKKH